MCNRALIPPIGPLTVRKPSAVQEQTPGKHQVMQESAPPTSCEVKFPFQNRTMLWSSQPKSSLTKLPTPRAGEKPQTSVSSTSFDQNIPTCQGQVIHNPSPDSNTPKWPQGIVPISPVLNLPVKRRLGMGRGTVGYSNKKFKPPT